ncbi:glycerate kinase isoform X2 [Choloepus didactylus]|uniref:glycerate kinase isoform X2 n=1 Tax=Choloepus didactylus TaxID=27675 RepID=UPI0018A0E86C|nr:glycerate kinase isoform X2 [Choloepus didactylus]
MAAALQILPRLARPPLCLLPWGGSMARLASGMALAEHARKLFESAVGAVLPGPVLHRALTVDLGSGQLKVRDRNFQLRQNLYLVGFGKAVLGMAAAAEELLGQHLVQGVISVPKGIRAAMEDAGKQEMLLKPHSRVLVFEGAEHNLPDHDALRAALAIQQLAAGLTADDLLLVLISDTHQAAGSPWSHHPGAEHHQEGPVPAQGRGAGSGRLPCPGDKSDSVRRGGGPCGGDRQRPNCGQRPQRARLPAHPQSLRPPCCPATFCEDCASSG